MVGHVVKQVSQGITTTVRLVNVNASYMVAVEEMEITLERSVHVNDCVILVQVASLMSQVGYCKVITTHNLIV